MPEDRSSAPGDQYAALEVRIQALENIAAIKDLKARYLRGCDLQQPEEVRATLMPDAIVAYEGFPTFTTRDSFVDTFERMGCQPGIYDIHHGTNPVIELVSDDRATGKWSLFFQNINVTNRSIIQMAVEYDDVYLRRDGQWWISETRTKRTSFLMQQIDDGGIAKVAAFGEAPGTFGE
jgi:SnoaL-like domain